MTLVLDASMAIAWLFEDERTDATEVVLDRVAGAGAIVPTIWKLEVASGLQAAMRRGRIDISARNAALSRLGALGIETDPETGLHAWMDTLALADRHGLTPYDASYLELAIRRRLPLATLDAALVRAGKTDGIEMMGS